MPDLPCLLKNITNRPVELHMEGALTILAPGQSHRVNEEDAYCMALVRKGVLSAHDVPPEKPPKKRKSSPRKKPARKAATKTAKATSKSTAATKAKSASAKAQKTAKPTSRKTTSKKTTKSKPDTTGGSK